MAMFERLICASDALIEQGKAVCFPLDAAGDVTGFVVRYRGAAHGYINQCAHMPVQMDWQEGEFFDLTRHMLICATHGAQYAPDTGVCELGPCVGKSLKKLKMSEHDGNVYLITEQ